MAVSCAQYLLLNSKNVAYGSGALLIASALLGYLNGAAGLMAKETVFFQPPLLNMPWAPGHGVTDRRRMSVDHSSDQNNKHYNTAPYQESQLNRAPYHETVPIITPVYPVTTTIPSNEIDVDRFARRDQPVNTGLAPPIVSAGEDENRMKSIDLRNDRL